MLSLCRYSAALLRFWFQTNLGRENLAQLFKNAVVTVGHAICPLFTLWFVKIWQVS